MKEDFLEQVGGIVVGYNAHRGWMLDVPDIFLISSAINSVCKCVCVLVVLKVTR